MVQPEKVTTRKNKAISLFLEGYNCAQSALLAFEDKIPLERTALLKLSSSFGGGFGRMREVCGAVSGVCMAAGLLFGYDDPCDSAAKASHYALIQDIMKEFAEKNSSYICREILKNPSALPVPSERTPEFYKTRPCCRMVESAVEILEKRL